MKLQKLLHDLKQGDPRAVAFLCVLLFFGSVLWLVWTVYGPGEPTVPAIPGGASRMALPEQVPLGEILAAQQEVSLGETPPNPFHRPVEERPTRPVRPDRPERTDRPTPPPPPPPPLPPPPPPPPPPPRETVTYVLRGTLTRPDGARVAQVHNPRTGASLFVQAGSALPPFTVDAVETDIILLAGGENGPIRLRRGEEQTFTLP